MTRHFVLVNHGVTVTVTEDGGVYRWDVSNGKRHVQNASVYARDLRAVLTDIANRVVMPSRLAQGRLRSIATQPMRAHEHVPASELRPGDLLYVGGTNYILVKTAEVDGDVVRVLAHGGKNPFARAVTELCNLSMRDATA